MNPPDHERSKGASKPFDAQPSPVEWARHHGLTTAVLDELALLNRRRKRRRFLLGSGAAGLLMIGFASVWLVKTPPPAPAPPAAPAAIVMGPAHRTLADGTRIEEKEGSQLSVSFDESTRRVQLVHGAAHFEVSRDASRPFVVEAGGAVVRALGTAFCVQVDAGGLDILVTEGLVSVAPPPGTVTSGTMKPSEPAQLAPGDRITVTTDKDDGRRVLTQGTFNPGALTEHASWKAPRLKFSRAPLSEVVAAFNRHNRTRLVIGDPELADLELSGTLQADRTSALLSILRANFEIQAENGDGGIIVLRRVR